MPSGGVQIRVSDMIFALKKRWKLILSLTLIGLVFGILLFTMTYVQDSYRSYEVSGSFAISTQTPTGVYINGSQIANNNDYHLAEDMVDAVVYVLRSNAVLTDVINQQGLLGTTVDELRSNLTLNQYQATQIVEMHFTWRTAEQAADIWQAIITAANQIIPDSLQLGQLAVINPPEVIQSSTAGSSKVFPVLLAMLGLLSGVGFAVIELMIRPTLTNPRDAETMFGLETIGIIPSDEAFFRSRQGSILTTGGADRSGILQNYSAASYILRNRLGTKEPHHCFYVTSAASSEGKSTVAANLAIQLSDMEHRTLLVDFDVRNPSLGTLFMDKVDYTHSLNALYRGEATEEDAITTLTGYLDLLPAVLEHNTISMDGAVTDLIERLTQKYEYVILDTAPVGEVSETLSLNRVANTVLFVIGYDSTPLPAVQSALEKLDKSGIRVLGCVVNGVGQKSGGEEKRRRSAPPPAARSSRKKNKKQPARAAKKAARPSRPAEKTAAPVMPAMPAPAMQQPAAPQPAQTVQTAPAAAPAPQPAPQAPAAEKTASHAANSRRLSLFGAKKEKPVAKHAKGGRHSAAPQRPAAAPAAQPTAAPVPQPVVPVPAPAAPVSAPAAAPAVKMPAAPPKPVRMAPPPVETMSIHHHRDVLSELMAEEPQLRSEDRSMNSVMDELMAMGTQNKRR